MIGKKNHREENIRKQVLKKQKQVHKCVLQIEYILVSIYFSKRMLNENTKYKYCFVTAWMNLIFTYLCVLSTHREFIAFLDRIVIFSH